MAAAAAVWANSLRGGKNPPGSTIITSGLKNSPLQTSKTARLRSPNRAFRAPLVRRFNSSETNKLSPNSRTATTTVMMEGREEAIQIHLPLKPPKFNWKVDNEKGYFELGTPSNDDDRYTINITIIAASYLHLLGADQSINQENYNWAIQYKAFDCDITSDPFQLDNEDVSRCTFIGDKATARIRANGGMFCEFLTHTTIEFHATQIRTVEGTEKVVGITCLDLKELAKPHVNELKHVLEMISTDGDVKENRLAGKAEIRVLVELETDPSFFTNLDVSEVKEKSHIEEIKEKLENCARGTEKQDLTETSALGGGVEPNASKSKGTVTFQEDMPDSLAAPQIGESGGYVASDEDNDRDEGYLKDIINEFEKLENVSREDRSKSNLGISPSKGGGDEVKSTVSTEFDRTRSRSRSPARKQRFNNAKETQTEERSFKIAKSPQIVLPKSTVVNLSPGEKETSTSFNSDDTFWNSSGRSQYEVQVGPVASNTGLDIVKAGRYQITIKLNYLWVQCGKPLANTFVLSYKFPPLGIVKPISCTAYPEPTITTGPERNRCAIILDGTWAVVADLSLLSPELCHEPLILEIRNQKYTEHRQNVLYAHVPFGKVFFQQLHGRKRKLVGTAEVLKANNKKVGLVDFTIQTELLKAEELYKVDNGQTETASTRAAVAAVRQDQPFSHKTKASLDNWKNAEETEFRRKPGICEEYFQSVESMCQSGQKTKSKRFDQIGHLSSSSLQASSVPVKTMLHEREKAYLRILSEEWTKRDHEREALVAEKIHCLEKREKELEKQMQQIHAKESALKALETEVRMAAIKNTSEQTHVLDETKYKIRQLEIEHKHEVHTLQRRVADYLAEFEKVRGKVLILESKLRTKDEELNEMMRCRNKWPEVEHTLRLDALEKQNSLLSSQLATTERERDKYKREANALCHQLKCKQREHDARLYKENENLKVQLYANEQKRGLDEETQSVKEISEKIKKLLEKDGMESNSSGLTGRGREPGWKKAGPTARQSKEIKRRLSEEKAASKKATQQGQEPKDDRQYIEREIERLTSERHCLLDSGSYSQYDVVVRTIENQITKLANSLNHFVRR